jgi:excinuclease UvrABC ATPase subunit
VIVIEHDLDVISRADHVIDLGPGAGHDGGRLVFAGSPAELVEHPTSVTGEHLARRHAVARSG